MCCMLIYHMYICVLYTNNEIIFLLSSRKTLYVMILAAQPLLPAPITPAQPRLGVPGLSFCSALLLVDLVFALVHCEFCEGQGLRIGPEHSRCSCGEIIQCTAHAVSPLAVSLSCRPLSELPEQSWLQHSVQVNAVHPVLTTGTHSISIHPPFLPRSSGDSRDMGAHRHSNLQQVSWQQR